MDIGHDQMTDLKIVLGNSFPKEIRNYVFVELFGFSLINLIH